MGHVPGGHADLGRPRARAGHAKAGQVEDGFIVLVSDLETAPEDVQTTTRMIQDIQRSDIDLRVVPMAASGDSLRLFPGLLGPKAFVVPAAGGDEWTVQSARGTGVPTGLLALGGLLFALLALHERFAGRLALPRAKGSRA